MASYPVTPTPVDQKVAQCFQNVESYEREARNSHTDALTRYWNGRALAERKKLDALRRSAS